MWTIKKKFKSETNQSNVRFVGCENTGELFMNSFVCDKIRAAQKGGGGRIAIFLPLW